MADDDIRQATVVQRLLLDRLQPDEELSISFRPGGPRPNVYARLTVRWPLVGKVWEGEVGVSRDFLEDEPDAMLHVLQQLQDSRRRAGCGPPDRVGR